MATIGRGNIIRGALSPELHARVELTAVEVRALNTAPQTLAPAKAGRFLMAKRVIVRKPAGTKFAGIASGEDLAVQYAGTGTPSIHMTIESTGFLDQATAQSRAAVLNGNVAGEVGVAIQLRSVGAITGGGPVIVDFFYEAFDG